MTPKVEIRETASKSVMSLTVPLPIVIAMLSASVCAALALFGFLYAINSHVIDIQKMMVTENDVSWYAHAVARLNPGHPIPDVNEYFRLKHCGEKPRDIQPIPNNITAEEN